MTTTTPPFTDNVWGTGTFGLQDSQMMVGVSYGTRPAQPAGLRVQTELAYHGGTDAYIQKGLWSLMTSKVGVRDTGFAIVGEANNEGDGGHAMVGVFGIHKRVATTAHGGFGGCFENRDITGQSNSDAIGVEIDIFANGTDNNGWRSILDLVGGKGVDNADQCEISWGMRIGPTNGDHSLARWKTLIGLKGRAEVGIDFEEPTSKAAIRLRQNGAKISFDADDQRYLRYIDGSFGYVAPGNNPKFVIWEDGGISMPILTGDPARPGHQGEFYFCSTTNTMRICKADGWHNVLTD